MVDLVKGQQLKIKDNRHYIICHNSFMQTL